MRAEYYDMLDRRENMALIILIGIFLLLLAAHGALAAAGSATFAAPWAPEAEDGTFVAVRGTVDDLRHLTGGAPLGDDRGSDGTVSLQESVIGGTSRNRGRREM